MDTTNDRLEAAWAAHHAHVTNVAFRMLSDIGAAEDVTQEAFARLLLTEPGTIQDEGGWLIVVAGRLCLDQIRSARSRLDRSYPAERFEEDLSDVSAGIDPADRVTLDDNVRMALSVVLRRLSPAERVVFVLHDVFQVPFDTVAETVGRPASTCRQLATRARRRIADASDGNPFDVDRPSSERSENARVTEAFITACSNGDTDGLLSILDPDVSGDGDFGPLAAPVPVIVGAERVARRSLGYLANGPTLVSNPMSEEPEVLVFFDRELLVVITITIDGDHITKLHATGNPEHIRSVTAQLAGLA